MMKKKQLEIGEIVTVFGLKGEVKVMPWCDYPDMLCEFNSFNIDSKEIKVESARIQKNMGIIRFEGYTTVEQAQTLRGKILFVDRDSMQLPENSYFIQDLIGLEVSDADSGKIYGKIKDVLQTGANDVYVISDGEREILVPAIPDVVISTDIDNEKMLIRPLKGLFD